jgi:BTB/POZ domain-containing protein 10
VKSKSVTNLAEATADPALELDAGGNPVGEAIMLPMGVEMVERGPPEELEGAVGGLFPPPPPQPPLSDT